MKLKHYSQWALALAFAAVSCSDELENGGSDQSIKGNGVYLTVDVKTPSSNGTVTKADGDKPTGGEEGDGYLTALENEYRVKNVTIVLYGKDGANTEDAVKNLSINDEGTRVIATAYGATKTVDSPNPWPNHEEQKATVRLNSNLLQKNTYYRILAIANYDATSLFPQGASLADCKIKTIANHKTTDIDGDEVFIMSTHVEKNQRNGSGPIEHSTVMFEGTETTEATAATGTVWVERLSARIDYTGTTYNFPVKPTGETSAIANVTLQGVAPVNVAKHPVYVFKHLTEDDNINGTLKALIDEEYTTTKKNYVIEPTTAGRNTTTINKDFDYPFQGNFVGDYKSFTDNTWETYNESTFTPTTGETSLPSFRIITYTGENTMSVNDQKHGNTTGVIFKAEYKPESLLVYDANNGNVNPETKPTDGFNTGFYRVNDKIYKTLEAAEAELIIAGTDLSSDSPLAWLRKNFTSTTTWTLPSTISFATFKAAVETAATGTKDLGYLKFLYGKLKDVETFPTSSEINWNAFMTAKSIPENSTKDNKVISSDETLTIEYYGTDHICYYPYWIRHANNGNNKEMDIMEFCIVRNNVYQLAVTDITKLGMADPFDSKDTPDEGEDEVYLKVKLYVRHWVVRQNNNIVL